MKNLSIVLMCSALVAFASCQKSENTYSYTKKSNRGNFTINAPGKTYVDTITVNNYSSFSITAGNLYYDTASIPCLVLGVTLYDSNATLNIEARKLTTDSKLGTYRIGSISSMWWSTIGSFTFSSYNPYGYYYGNSQDTTNASYVTITSFSDNGKVQEVRGNFKLHAVTPTETDITGDFYMRK